MSNDFKPSKVNPAYAFELFRNLGLKPPRRVYLFAGAWTEEGFEITPGVVGAAPAERPTPYWRCEGCGVPVLKRGTICNDCAEDER